MRYLFFFALLISRVSYGQNPASEEVHIQVFCGFGGITSTEIKTCQSFIRSKDYVLIRLKIYRGNPLEKVLSAIALKELQSQRRVDLTERERNQISTISLSLQKYRLCYTCTQQFEGSVSDLLTNVKNPAYYVLKAAIFNSN